MKVQDKEDTPKVCMSDHNGQKKEKYIEGQNIQYHN